MLRKFSFCLAVAGGALLALADAAAAQGYTTRIETRPFYGATVTLEEGVRVIRALPPERQVIINPDGTPLMLGFNETNIYDRRAVYNRNVEEGGGGGAFYGPDGPYYNAPLWGRGFRKGPHFGHHRQPPRGNGD
jgi:hypothetical protein